MKTYIRFEDGQQVEATILATKPAGNDWKKAPQNFDFSKRYKLAESGTIEEISSEELDSMRLNIEKTNVLIELKRIINNAVGKYIGENSSKQKSYELQENAANAVIDGQGSSHELLIKPLADIRNISVLEMAELILEKAAIANYKVIQAEAIEDQYQELIEDAETISRLDELLTEVSIQMENF
jgi:hypothetical protein